MASEPVYVFYPFVGAFGGIERLILDLAAWLRDRGQPLHLMTFQCDVDLAAYGGDNLRVDVIRSGRALGSEVRALRRFMRERKIPSSRVLVMEMRGALYAGLAMSPGYHVHIADPPSLLPRDISKWAFSNSYEGALLQSQPGLSLRLRGQLVHWLNRRGVRRANRVLTMTQRNVEELLRAYGRTFIRIFPGVHRPPELPRTAPSPNSEIRFLSVCRLEPSKRVDAILNSFAELTSHRSTVADTICRLWIVGTGSQEEVLKHVAAERGIADVVTFFGLVSEDRLEEIYTGAHVFVMPARQGYGLPGLEALIRGLSLVVHKESGVVEALTDAPRVQIIDDSGPSLTAAMNLAAEQLLSGETPQPDVPTSDDWARRICEECGWT